MAKPEEIPPLEEHPTHYHSNRFWFGMILLIIGLIFLLKNLGLVEFDFERFWPAFLIIIGLLILFRKN